MVGQRRILLANSIYHLTNDGAVTVLAGQIAVLQAVFGGFGPIEVGLLGGSALLVTAVFQFLFGIMADRRDPSRFLPVGIAILGLGSLLVTLSWSFWTLLVFVALSRIGASFYHPVGILGWQSPFLLWGGINLAAVALGLYLVRGRRYRPEPSRPSVADYFGVLRDVRLWLLPLALGGAAYNIVSYFGPLLLVTKFSLAKDAAGVAVALWILAGAIAAFFFGRVSRRFGRYRTLLASYAGIGLAGLISGLLDNLVLVIAILWTLGSALFLTYPGIFAFVSESSHRRLQGAAFGLIFAFQLLGGAAGLFLAGVLADRFGSTPGVQASIPFVVAGVLGLAGFVALFLSRSRVSNARKPVPSSVPPL